ncbi:hypothetical protein B0H13DRAFT_1860678 [Mycena leptocephala]|nr:hypothetical protein B0H13DRAFT_1860678 [Mycena leptocephala]
MFAIGTGTGPYSVLDKVQCDVRFKHYNFEVSVNMTSSLVTINPLASSTHDMDPTSAAIGIGFGTIPQLVMRQVTFLLMVNTNLYTSVLGNMFLSNIMNVATARNGSVNDTSVILEGISSSLESMIDDILVGIGSAQLEIAGTTSGVIANATIATMRLGDFQYAVTVTVLNFLAVIVYLVECVCTRGWKGMPVFDHNDIASTGVIVVVSWGGPEVGDAVAAAHKVNGTLWLGDARNMAGGQTRMTLVNQRSLLGYVGA